MGIARDELYFEDGVECSELGLFSKYLYEVPTSLEVGLFV